jgi:Protein of unknown function (DUF3892)
MSIRITQIRKPSGWNANPHEAISNLTWIEDLTGKFGIASREQMYDFLKNRGVAYVKDARGDVAYLYPKENLYGTKYVQTYADGIWKDNLLALPTIS